VELRVDLKFASMASANGSVSSRGEFSYQLKDLNIKLRNGLNEVVSMGMQLPKTTV